MMSPGIGSEKTEIIPIKAKRTPNIQLKIKPTEIFLLDVVCSLIFSTLGIKVPKFFLHSQWAMAPNVRVYLMLRLKGVIWAERSVARYTLLADVGLILFSQ